MMLNLLGENFLKLPPNVDPMPINVAQTYRDKGHPRHMVPPKGDSAVARAGSTWIHWKSPVASAKVSTRRWSIVSQSVTQTSRPTAAWTAAVFSKCRAVCMASGMDLIGFYGYDR